ncbi:hypothetical protein ACEQ8H_005738 [Pleosporales sp. CAS-2024a]
MAAIIEQPCALSEGDRFYVLRRGVMVPLVPADQIPLQLRGVPRQLSHRQMSDENWRYLHETKHSATRLEIQAPAEFSSPMPTTPPSRLTTGYLAPDHHVRNSSSELSPATSIVRRWPPPSYLAKNADVHAHARCNVSTERPASLTDAIAPVYHKNAQQLGARTTYPSGIKPNHTLKEYCTHWIQTGECRYLAIGCIFKHEMPNIDKLRELGFTRVPLWWKEKAAITARGPTWLRRQLAASRDENSSADELDSPPPREFPDPASFRAEKSIERAAKNTAHEKPRSIVRKGADMERRERVHRMRDSCTSLLGPATQPNKTVTNLIDLDESPVGSRRSSTSASSCEGEVEKPNTRMTSPSQSLRDKSSASTRACISPSPSQKGSETTTAASSSPEPIFTASFPPPAKPKPNGNTTIRRASLPDEYSSIEEGPTTATTKLVVKDTNLARTSTGTTALTSKSSTLRLGLAGSKYAAAATTKDTNDAPRARNSSRRAELQDKTMPPGNAANKKLQKRRGAVAESKHFYG